MEMIEGELTWDDEQGHVVVGEGRSVALDGSFFNDLEGRKVRLFDYNDPMGQRGIILITCDGRN